MRLAAGSVALVGRQGRVAIDQFHAIEGHAKFFGDQLGLRGDDALAEFFLAGVGGDAAVGGDGDPGIELVGTGRTGEATGDELRMSVRFHASPKR